MSLTQRKPRPLIRDADSLRDDRLFIVACDDTYAPKQYFDFSKISRVRVYVVSTEDGTSVAKSVLSRLLAFDHEDDDELWMLLDTDHCIEGTHFSGFITALKDAQRKGVQVALSRPCFELWLLLHHVNESAVIALKNAGEVEKALRKVLGGYNKTRLKHEHYSLESVYQACLRAERLDGAVSSQERPEANTSRVYQLWKAIAEKALPSQLPDELKQLLPK